MNMDTRPRVPFTATAWTYGWILPFAVILVYAFEWSKSTGSGAYKLLVLVPVILWLVGLLGLHFSEPIPLSERSSMWIHRRHLFEVGQWLIFAGVWATMGVSG